MFASKNNKKLRDERACTAKALLIGTAIGAAVGVGTALLLAPKSGAELRQDILDTCTDASEKARELSERAANQGKEFACTVQNQANRWIALGHNILDKFSANTSEVVEDIERSARRSEILNEVADWAILGLKAVQNFAKR